MHLNEYAESHTPASPEKNPTVTSLVGDPSINPASAPIVDTDRYSRQILFPGIGAAGQQMLAAAHVAIVGCGATGTASASLLARAGVGTLTLIDRDFVEPSNLQRQVLFDEADARDTLPKAEAARRHIARFNSRIAVHARIADLTPDNIADLLAPVLSVDIILDATDNFETRYLINDFAVQRGIAWIYAAAIAARATTMNILPLQRTDNGEQATAAVPCSLFPVPYHPTACLACIFPTSPAGNIETCDNSGVLASAVNLAASIQVTEALKFLTGQPHLMRRTLLSFDLWGTAGNVIPQDDGQYSRQGNGYGNGYLDHSEIATGKPRPDCTVCGQRIFDHLLGHGRPHITLCGRDSVQIHERHRPIDFASLEARLRPHADIQDLRCNNLLLRFRRGPYTLTFFADGRAIIQGTTDIALARSLYARFIGV